MAKVHLVDDDLTMVQMVTELLRQKGHEPEMETGELRLGAELTSEIQ